MPDSIKNPKAKFPKPSTKNITLKAAPKDQRLGWRGDNAEEALRKTVAKACDRSKEGAAFRAKCLKSPADAKEAVEKAGGVAVPEEMSIMFIEAIPEPNCAVIMLPPAGTTDFPALQQMLRCCYQPYS